MNAETNTQRDELAQTITNADTEYFDGEGDLYQRNGDHWYAPEELDYYWTTWLTLPATILYTQEAAE